MLKVTEKLVQFMNFNRNQNNFFYKFIVIDSQRKARVQDCNQIEQRQTRQIKSQFP